MFSDSILTKLLFCVMLSQIETQGVYRMGNTKLRIRRCAGLLFLGVLAAAFAFLPNTAEGAGAESTQLSRNGSLVVRYHLDETATAAGQTLAAYKWDAGTQAYVAAPEMNATVQNDVNGRDAGEVRSVQGVEGSALSFTGKAHARAEFHLPQSATGMTISLWVKNITTYWGSLLEFWDGTQGGRLGKGTMQGNGGRRNEADPWSANCAAHTDGTAAPGGGWDSFFIEGGTYNNNNGGSAVDPMKADTWYQVTYVVTESEMRAYRDGELKQTFSDRNDTPTILRGIMAAAKNQTAGKFGIRLAHDSTADRADILDDLRIYSGAMSDEEVRELYFEYDPSAEWFEGVPEYYEAEGLAYPDLLLGGAASVREEGGVKKGTAQKGVEYSYTPVQGTPTPERDEQGVEVTFSKDGIARSLTVKFRRTLGLKAEKLGYKLGDGANVPLSVPESPEDILVKLPAGTDLAQIKAGENAVQKLAGDDRAENYECVFKYSPSAHAATVRCAYLPYAGQETFYTILFAEKSTATFTRMTVAGGEELLTLTPESFSQNTATVYVKDLASFELRVTLSLAEGATSDGKESYTQADLNGGKIAIAVTNENGDRSVYSLAVVQRSAEATLSSLSAEGYTLSPAFSPETLAYGVTVDKGEETKVFEKLTFTAAAGASAEKRYDPAEGRILIIVTAENGSVRTYTVGVTARETDATLSAIEVGGTAIRDFSPETYGYTVKYKGELPAVTAQAASAKADVSVGGTAGEVQITVTAESGAQKTYTVTLVKMSADASLLKLTLGGEEIALADGKGEYRAPAGTRLETIAVRAETAEGASYTYTADKANNTLLITVRAEDGTEAEYAVTVILSGDASFGAGVPEDNSPEESGCGGAVTTGALVLFTLAAGAALLKKRKDQRGNRYE